MVSIIPIPYGWRKQRGVVHSDAPPMLLLLTSTTGPCAKSCYPKSHCLCFSQLSSPPRGCFLPPRGCLPPRSCVPPHSCSLPSRNRLLPHRLLCANPRAPRASWTQTELLLTFPTPLIRTSSLQPLTSPETGGRFRVWLDRGQGNGFELVWDRKSEGGFPELKVLKQRVRNLVQPEMSLGHSDKTK